MREKATIIFLCVALIKKGYFSFGCILKNKRLFIPQENIAFQFKKVSYGFVNITN